MENEHQNGPFFTLLRACMAQKQKKSSRNQKPQNRLPITENILKSEGRKFGKCEFSIKMWVVPKFERKKFAYTEKMVGPENGEEKYSNLWKNHNGNQISPETNFRHIP